MHFYRPLQKLHALSFDLDDTLYDNQPVIKRAEYELTRFLQLYHPALRNLTPDDCQLFRKRLRQKDPEICHDVNNWRKRSIELMIRSAGLDEKEVRICANAAMNIILYWRNKVNVPKETHETLAALKTRWPLVAITNGNSSPELFGLADYFLCILRAGKDGRAKPWKDMYELATIRLNVSPKNILHIGDDLETDVAGAVRYGMQACWINNHGDNLMAQKNQCLLPHLEISKLKSLKKLL